MWCDEFILVMQAACEHWKEEAVGRFFLIACYGLWTLRGMKQERIFCLKAEIIVVRVEFLDWDKGRLF